MEPNAAGEVRRKGNITGLAALGQAEVGPSLPVPAELAPYVDHIRPEVEVLFCEPEYLTLTNSECEPEVNGDPIPLLYSVPHRVDCGLRPRLRLRADRLGPFDRSVDSDGALQQALVINRGIQDGGEVYPYDLGGRLLDSREQVGLEPAKGRGVDLAQRIRAEQGNQVVPDPAPHGTRS